MIQWHITSHLECLKTPQVLSLPSARGIFRYLLRLLRSPYKAPVTGKEWCQVTAPR